MEERIINLENKINIFSQEIKEIKANNNIIFQILNKIELLDNKLDNLIDNLNSLQNNNKNKNLNINNNDNSDEKLANINLENQKGSLNNDKNPFIIAQNKINKLKISSDNESDDNSSEANNYKKRKNYVHDPIYYIFIIENKKYRYTCKKKHGKFTLPFTCSDTSCPATAKYNKLSEKFIIGETKHIPYEQHSYIIPKILKEKFNNDLFNENDFKNNLKNIGHYFKLLFLKDYTLDPTTAKSIFSRRFPNIDLTGNDINTYIKTKYKESQKINHEKIKNTEKIFSLCDENGILLSKVIDINEENNQIKYKKIILIANNEMIENFKNNQITQYFMDCTYKAVPPSTPKFKLMIISAYDNQKKKTVICSFILLHKEDEITFTSIFKYLKENYSFAPSNFMCDFNKSQIKAIQTIFPETKIHCCFFHFSQAIWKNFRKHGLCGKGTYNSNSELLFNLQILCFIEKKNIINFYKKINNNFKEEKYKSFFAYFKNNWLGNKYPTSLWNFNNILNDELNINKFQFTNNLTENLNKQINKYLKRGKCSNYIFRESILNIITQFKNKEINSENNLKKSELILFYIKRSNKNLNPLSKNEIDNLIQLYNEIQFENINSEYNDAMDLEPDIVSLPNDSD